MQAHYRGLAFEFLPSPGDEVAGRLFLDDGRRELLAALIAAEDKGWYLDDNGERLPPEALFARWSHDFHAAPRILDVVGQDAEPSVAAEGGGG